MNFKQKYKKINSLILCETISTIDNKTEIVVIATGINRPSRNPKTGSQIQIWILLKNTNPVEAVNGFIDNPICGDCPHKKQPDTNKRTCYVNLIGVNQVYKSYLNKAYPHYDPNQHDHYFYNKSIRFGAYGDPALIPFNLLEHLAALSDTHTGYTHQFKLAKYQAYKKYYMASCDNLNDYIEACDLGWSTFRVKPLNEPSQKIEIDCMGGIKTTCKLCSLCNGSQYKQNHIAIEAHGHNKHLIK